MVVFSNSFHGRTLGVLNLTRQSSVMSDYVQYKGFDIVELPFNDIQAFVNYTKDNNPLAVLIEPIQGSGGINIASDEFLIHLAKYCVSSRAYLALDEVQCGMGRTGTMFSFVSKEIKPDFVLFGKGTGGGIPLSGVILNERTSKNIKQGDHGTTWCNPHLSAATGLFTIKFIQDNNVLANVLERSAQFKNILESFADKFNFLSDIRIKGLMIGITLNLEPSKCKELQLLLCKNGLLVDITQGNILRLLPPLTISSNEVKEALDIFERTLYSFV